MNRALPDPNAVRHAAAPVLNKYRNRIIGHEDVDPLSLLAHPDNYRVHPHAQELGMATILGTLGWLDSVLVNKPTGRVINGHMRVAHAISEGEATVPVDWVDLDDAQEKLALATFDAIGSLAVPDVEKREALYAQLQVDTANSLRLLFGQAQEATSGYGGGTREQAAPSETIRWSLTFPATAETAVREALTDLTDTVEGLSWNENG